MPRRVTSDRAHFGIQKNTSNSEPSSCPVCRANGCCIAFPTTQLASGVTLLIGIDCRLTRIGAQSGPTTSHEPGFGLSSAFCLASTLASLQLLQAIPICVSQPLRPRSGIKAEQIQHERVGMAPACSESTGMVRILGSSCRLVTPFDAAVQSPQGQPPLPQRSDGSAAGPWSSLSAAPPT
ncbi:hypothetical protein M431DRAFT_494106 [Trichoderma harzianum CBS 226.95]|uniref:Uncharacterized protein n=1 Tax=Trichoderma harzianum CBS 226.95 TaxID=983964 RepID=A0A2T4AF10_TRIHA|nr:hypothetical protein M431DRAFT_494106 [Trichoderma harzianum CBS 226.95]PTB55667.1 hypothetical protein M431DRAFT_494106 [Trichoderma harzianum CBS 226.95]